MGISIKTDKFGEIISDGNVEDVIRITISNEKIDVQLMTYGATIISLKVPGKLGGLEDIVLGFDDLPSYVNHTHYFGSTIGRFANRIAEGKFVLNDEKYTLVTNNGPNHLHGGTKGFDKVLWDWNIVNNKVVFTYTSPSMEENYPGELKCKATYELNERNELIINYEASTDQATPVNLTNHSYFNLSGHGKELIHDHEVSINADTYTPVDENLIPLGVMADVKSTNFDLQEPKRLGTLLELMKDGFDHNFCINGPKGVERKVASVYHPKSGRRMEIFSTQPGVQFYTSNCLPEDDSLVGKMNMPYKRHGAICLETQNYPNAINQPNFPKAILEANEIYNHTTRFIFSYT